MIDSTVLLLLIFNFLLWSAEISCRKMWWSTTFHRQTFQPITRNNIVDLLYYVSWSLHTKSLIGKPIIKRHFMKFLYVSVICCRKKYPLKYNFRATDCFLIYHVMWSFLFHRMCLMASCKPMVLESQQHLNVRRIFFLMFDAKFIATVK